MERLNRSAAVRGATAAARWTGRGHWYGFAFRACCGWSSAFAARQSARYGATATTQGRSAPARAFSLIELIGVLAVIAILAAVLVPAYVRQLDRAAWTKETVDLGTIAHALEQSILRSKTIPDPTGIPAAVANELALPVNAITTTPRKYDRAFLVDPGLRINGATLPYAQSAGTTISAPTNARLMIVSSLSRAVPVASGLPSASAFNDIWDTPENSRPSTWTSWPGSGEDLRIQRINLQPLFLRIMLVNRDTNGAGRFSIDSTNSASVPVGPVGVDAYYLDGSVLGLHDSAGVCVTRYLLKHDISFVFERNQWRGWIGPGDPYYTTADSFVRESAEFLAADWNASARRGASQTGVLAAMYVLMFDYALWAEECPRFSRHGASGGSNPQLIPEYSILDSLGKNEAGGILSDASENLLNR